MSECPGPAAEPVFEVVETDGRLLARARVPGALVLAVNGDRVLVRRLDGLGVESVEVYRIVPAKPGRRG